MFGIIQDYPSKAYDSLIKCSISQSLICDHHCFVISTQDYPNTNLPSKIDKVTKNVIKREDMQIAWRYKNLNLGSNIDYGMDDLNFKMRNFVLILIFQKLLFTHLVIIITI